MKKIGLVIDSISSDIKSQDNLYIVSIKSTIVNNKEEVIKPDTKSFINAFNTLKEKGYHYIICLLSNDEIFGFTSSANLAKTIIEDSNIYIIDSKTFGPGINYLINNLNDYIKSNESINKILSLLNQDINKGIIYLSINKKIDLVYNINVKKSRVKKAYLLSINNEITIIKQAFFKKIIYKKLKDILLSYINSGLTPKIIVFYTNNNYQINELINEINSKYNLEIYGVLSKTILHLLNKDSVGFYINN